MNEVSDDCMHLHTYIHTVHALQRKAQNTPLLSGGCGRMC